MGGELRDIRVIGGTRVKHPYWMLLKKEVAQALPMFIIFVVGIVAWQGFLWTRIAKGWHVDLIVGLSMAPTGAIPLWLLWRSFSTLRQEWTGNHMYLLLALPIPGWYIASVKAFVVMLEAAAYVLITGVGSLLLMVATGSIPIEFTEIPWGSLAATVLISFLAPLVGVIVIQFSYIAGRLASRWSGVISAITFVLSMWFIVRVGTLLAPWLHWLPEIPIRGHAIVDGIPMQTALYVNMGPVVGMLVAVSVLFWLGSSFIERDVEL